MAIVGPVPPFNNPAIQAYYYQPSVFDISAVSLGALTTISTSVNHNYVIGQLIRLIIPPSFGCRQLNERQGQVVSIPAANQVIVNIDSSQNVDSYIASSATTVAQILAIGDISNGYTSSTGINIPSVTIPGAFINISPNEVI